jgi:hypothetical protein
MTAVASSLRPTKPAAAAARPSIGPVVQTRIAPDLAAAIEATLLPASEGREPESVADFMRAALWNEAARRGQTRPPQPLGLRDLADRIERLATEVQGLRNGERLQLALLQGIAAELSPVGT